MPSFAAGGAAARNLFFATKGNAAVTAAAGLHKYFGFSNEQTNKTPQASASCSVASSAKSAGKEKCGPAEPDFGNKKRGPNPRKMQPQNTPSSRRTWLAQKA